MRMHELKDTHIYMPIYSTMRTASLLRLPSLLKSRRRNLGLWTVLIRAVTLAIPRRATCSIIHVLFFVFQFTEGHPARVVGHVPPSRLLLLEELLASALLVPVAQALLLELQEARVRSGRVVNVAGEEGAL